MKKFGKTILKYLIVAALALAIGDVAITYFNDKQFAFNVRYILNGSVFVVVFFAVAGLLVYDLLKMLDGKGKKKDKAEDKVRDSKGREVKQFYDKDFVTTDDLEKVKGFNFNSLSSLRSSKQDGILVRAEEKGHSVDINFVKPIHTMIVGTTSSGKTSRFVVPSLQLMSMTASKPSFVVTDPKGELYDKCAHKFESEGYDVKVVNLRDTFASVQWNPMTYPFDLYTRSFNLDKEVKVHSPGDDPKRYNLIIQRPFDHSTTTWFEFNGTAYVDQTLLENDMRVISRKLYDDAYTALNDMCATLAPIENTKDSSWEKTAQRLIQAVMLASTVLRAGFAETHHSETNSRNIYATVAEFYIFHKKFLHKKFLFWINKY